jgi:hypothetical protein
MLLVDLCFFPIRADPSDRRKWKMVKMQSSHLPPVTRGDESHLALGAIPIDEAIWI